MTISDPADAPASMPRGVARMLAALCGASLLVKTLIYWTAPNLGNPDETFQYMEQAHRLVFGTGLVPWEFIAGIRSWLLPGLLVPGVALARALGTGPEFFPASSAAVCALLSLLPILCGGLWGWRANGMAGCRHRRGAQRFLVRIRLLRRPCPVGGRSQRISLSPGSILLIRPRRPRRYAGSISQACASARSSLSVFNSPPQSS
ncbi:MAG: hypothetical protein WDN69_35640 [Aliidongia sp.]